MKKQILLLLITVISLNTQAQNNIDFGVKAGLVSSGIRGDAVDNFKNLLDFADGMISTKNRTGFYAGGYASIPLSNQVSVEPGIYYSQKGYTLKGELGIKGLEFLGVNAKAQLQSDYIDMPVLLKANLGSGLQIFAGPQISYLAQSNLRTTAGLLGFNLLNKTMDVTEQFNRWDMGVTAGVGYQFSNGFNINASYDHGLSKIDANNNLNGYNNAIKVGIGIKF